MDRVRNNTVRMIYQGRYTSFLVEEYADIDVRSEFVRYVHIYEEDYEMIRPGFIPLEEDEDYYIYDRSESRRARERLYYIQRSDLLYSDEELHEYYKKLINVKREE